MVMLVRAATRPPPSLVGVRTAALARNRYQVSKWFNSTKEFEIE
jgi:hypothetical protein